MLPILEEPSVRHRAMPVSVEGYHCMMEAGLVRENARSQIGLGICDIYSSTFEIATKRQVTLAVLALHRYYLTHQAWPEKLEMATKTILLDPLDGTPLPYRLEFPQRWALGRWVIDASNDVTVASDDRR